jgi:hypothetical protein
MDWAYSAVDKIFVTAAVFQSVIVAQGLLEMDGILPVDDCCGPLAG